MATQPSRGYRAFARVLTAILSCMTVRDWSGMENLPPDQGFIAVSNHVTNADPVTLADFLYRNGFPPRFLAKSELFRTPVIGKLLYSLDQIPVYRGTAQAREAVVQGAAVLGRGDVIAMFPEGTLTKDPDLWPMVGRTGVARMALETGAPVIPVAQWGAHRLLLPHGKMIRPWPRKKITMVAGPPIDLEEFRNRPVDTELLRAATDRIMATLTAMVAQIRQEEPPSQPYDLRKAKS